MRKIITDNSFFSVKDYMDIQEFIYRDQATKPIALVAQGGGQLGIFTAGILDEFLQNHYDPFDLYIGTSAGALNIASFLTRQHHYAYRFITEITTDDRFFNLSRFIRHNESMNLDWAINNGIGLPQYALDIPRGRKTLKGKVGLATATKLQDLSPHYLPLFERNWVEVLKATSAIPLIYSDPVAVNDALWYDGGISASIPVQEAYRRGARIIVVLRTEPAEVYESSNEISTEKMKNIILEKSLTLRNHVKFPRWIFSKYDLHEVISMTRRHIDSPFVKMIIRHRQNQRETIEFLNNTPDDLLVFEIAPSENLKTHALLTKKNILDSEYKLGKKVGKRALHICKSIM